jgi:hypothetical protein
VRIVFCPTTRVVTACLFRSSQTDASAALEGSSWEGFGSLAFMNTTKWVLSVKSAI